METHEDDPTAQSNEDPWSEFQDEWTGLGDRLKETYRKVASEGGPSEDDVKDAFDTLLGAWNQVAGSVSSALQDPEVRQRLKDAGAAFATAIGRTISDLGSELRDEGADEGPAEPVDDV